MSRTGMHMASVATYDRQGTNVQDHVIDRFYQRFPAVRFLSPQEVRRHIQQGIRAARSAGRLESWGFGYRAPIEVWTQDAWVVVAPDGNVVTIYGR